MSEANVILSSEEITDFPDKWTAADLIYLEYNAAFECSASQEVISSTVLCVYISG